MTAENDSSDLEALFDSIAASPLPEKAPEPVAADDSDDLQALFDSVSSDYQAPVAAPVAAPAPPPAAAPVIAAPDVAAPDAAAAGGAWPAQEVVFQRIGHMARQLHDTIRELGYDKVLEKTVTAIPDAKDRLAYIANLTEQAACRVLNATDIANPLLDNVDANAKRLAERWDKVYANQLGIEDFKQLAADTRQFLKGSVPGHTQEMRAQLTEIMMAQDFQDLTGQVIKKVVSLAQDLEQGLMTVLVEVVPEERRTQEVDTLMNGPVINAEDRDVVVNQAQVDDLLESLGF